MTRALDVCTQIQTLMLADSAFDDVRLFVIGEPFIIKPSHYPLVEIVATDEQRGISESTGYYSTTVRGLIRISDQAQEIYDISGRAMALSTYTGGYTLINAAKTLFRQHANETLGGLGGTGWLVSYFTLDDLVEYGMAQRGVAYESQFALSWQVDIREVRT